MVEQARPLAGGERLPRKHSREHMGNKTSEERFWEKVEKTEGCWLWGASSDGRYGLFKAGNKITRAHRWIFVCLNGPIPEGLVVRHKCDNSLCVRPDHLELGTQSDNARDRVARGRHAQLRLRGRDAPTCKLSDAQAEALRKLARIGAWSQHCLAAAFGVTQGHVSGLKTGSSHARVA